MLEEVRDGKTDVDTALKGLKKLPYEDLKIAKVDNHRTLRQGFPEVIYGGGKTQEPIASIIDVLSKGNNNILVTRCRRDMFEVLRVKYNKAEYNELARTITLSQEADSKKIKE